MPRVFRGGRFWQVPSHDCVVDQAPRVVALSTGNRRRKGTRIRDSFAIALPCLKSLEIEQRLLRGPLGGNSMTDLPGDHQPPRLTVRDLRAALRELGELAWEPRTDLSDDDELIRPSTGGVPMDFEALPDRPPPDLARLISPVTSNPFLAERRREYGFPVDIAAPSSVTGEQPPRDQEGPVR